VEPRAAKSATIGNSENRLVSTGLGLPNSDKLKVTTILQHIIRELSEFMSEDGKIMIITKMVLKLMKLNVCYSS
jgi:hypothetical protein